MDRDTFSSDDIAEPSGTASDRLNSWKEVANYLGKGVRTVQRWEAQMGLPIRRLGREGGEIVYALRSEIDAWMEKQARSRADEPDPPPPVLAVDWAPPPEALAALLPPPLRTLSSQPYRPPVWASFLIVLAILGPAAASFSGKTGPPRVSPTNPAGASVEGDLLQVWAVGGRPLWSCELKAGADLRVDTRDPISPSMVGRRIAVTDLDGDGRNEVLVVVTSPSGSGGSLRVFNSDGTPRFSHAPGRPVTFGSTTYPGYNANGIYLIPNTDGSPSLWISASHVPMFPSILQQLSPRGEVVSEYWSNGTIINVRPAEIRGRSFLLVGGYNNERHGASLAFLDRQYASGTAPAENPYFRCLDCAQGEPEEFLVFPPSDLLNEATGGQGSAYVSDARLVGQSDLVATVRQMAARVPGETDPLDATVNYTLSVDSLELRGILPGSGYLSIHKSWERAGRLDHAFSAREEKDLSRVLRWSGGRFVPLADSLHDPVFARDAAPLPVRPGPRPKRPRRG